MSKILIGRGVTDSNGIATMTEDASGNSIQGYTGTGAGEVDFSAGCTIDERTFQSEIYELMDAMFYDSGVTGSANSDWFKASSTDVTTSIDSNGTLVSNIGSSNQFYLANKKGTSSGSFVNVKEFPIPFVMEFYLVEYTGTVNYHTYDGTTTAQHSLNGSNIGNGVTVRIEHDGTKQRAFVDNVSVGVFNHTLTGDCRVGFLLSPNASIKYRDFKVYPI